MTGHQMLALLQTRTKVADETKRINELNAAARWMQKRVFNSADGPDLLCTVGEELTPFVANTKTLDLITALSKGSQFVAVKKLWVKLPADTVFISMVPADINDPEYIDVDAFTAENPDIAQGHPVLYDVLNYSQVRFAPELPSGAQIRCDYFRMGPAIGTGESGESQSAELNEDWQEGVDLPSIFHDAIVNKATAYLFNMLDDDRDAMWEKRAEDELMAAIYMSRRQQYPTSTQPFRARRRRYI